MNEVIGYMSDLIQHSSMSEGLTVEQNLEQLYNLSEEPLQQTQQQAQANMIRMANGQIGMRTVSNDFVHMSPALGAQMLNNVNGQPMAPHMAAQLSQAGSASGPSTNTSPNIQNKRRRSTAPGIKEEGMDTNGLSKKVKPSPQMSKKTR
jgi:hypothetical protein